MQENQTDWFVEGLAAPRTSTQEIMKVEGSWYYLVTEPGGVTSTTLLSSHMHRLAARDPSRVIEVKNTQRGISRDGSKAACDQCSASCSPGAHFILPYMKQQRAQSCTLLVFILINEQKC